MTDDPNRARCERCGFLMSKEREEIGVCFMCSIAPSGKWEPRLPRIFTAPRKEERTGLLEENEPTTSNRAGGGT
jgi:hypothetical protein